ncbi:hypothetical protein A1O7_07703 [Cladophialophora yegresii CBS 114405]|uniref:Uncharacterized protein n=1 Tax=Cladophialophora yegresii CBS 114405 TaxID=1182544 RepID=W9VYP5_9EURO|nr:uncharacterized protein A1O7_07703 [Cladophialophora yegresii CBS 114405]EXJ57356.1 hypothetical protein A1O7_07703 [Cladophialophora yegresii CBS 114405]
MPGPGKAPPASKASRLAASRAKTPDPDAAEIELKTQGFFGTEASKAETVHRDAAASKVKTPRIVCADARKATTAPPDAAASEAMTPGQTSTTSGASHQLRSPLGQLDPNMISRTKRPLGSLDDPVAKPESKRSRLTPGLPRSPSTTGRYQDDLRATLTQALEHDDGDDWSDCSDFGDLEEIIEGDQDEGAGDGSPAAGFETEAVILSVPKDDSFGDISNGFAGEADGTTAVSQETFIDAVNALCRSFPREEAEIREFFDRDIDEDDLMPAVLHSERHEAFRMEEVAVSRMPEEDIPRPSGDPSLARIGWQLNHPTELCSEKPGETLDDKSPTTRLMMKKGVDRISSFTYDTINRRARIRRVKQGSNFAAQGRLSQSSGQRHISRSITIT